MMKRLLRITSAVFCVWLGSRICELSYKTTLYADCDAKCLIRKHYLLGHCILTELADTPFLNGGFCFVPRGYHSEDAKADNLIPIQTRPFMFYDPHDFYDGICRLISGHMELYLINREEEFCSYVDSNPGLIRAFVFERIKGRNVTPNSMTLDQFEEWSNETHR